MAKVAGGAKSQAIHEYLSKNPSANAQTIVDDLKQKGIEVSLGLAKVVKYGKKGKKASAKKVGRAAALNGKAVSGSESIRQFIARHPAAMPKEIELGLKQQGIKVSTGLISNVKYASGKKKSKKKRTRTATIQVAARKTRARKGISKATDITIEQLLEVKRLADSLGGAAQVRQALETLEQLR